MGAVGHSVGTDLNGAAPPDLALQEEVKTLNPSPPPSTRLTVDRAPDVPALISVDATSMSVQWSPVSITIRSTHLRVVECQEAYALQMQQVEVNSANDMPDIRDDRWSVQYKGTATYVQVKGLRPGRNYAVRVMCQPDVKDPDVIVDLAPPSEILLVRTPATPPSALAAPSLAVRQRNSLKLKWSEPLENGGHPILAYVVQCHPSPEGFEGQPTAEGMFEIYRGVERSFVIKRLIPGIRYSVRVKAINCIGESPFSPVAMYSTQASVPSAPDPIRISSLNHDSVLLQWEPVDGNGSEVSGYEVMMDDGLGGEFCFIGRTQEPRISVSCLRSGLTYRFRVLAENSEGKSRWSPLCTAQTAATQPLAPPPPAKESMSHNSIDISWRPPEYDGGSPLLRYEVELMPKCKAAKLHMTPDQWVLAFQGLETACGIQSLRPGCTYRVRVRAVNSQGAGPFSFPADISTSPANPEPPSEPSLVAKTQDSLTLQWNAPEHDGGSPILSYRLACKSIGPIEQPPSHHSKLVNVMEDSTFVTVYEGIERKTEISNLQPGMNYELKLTATNKQGSSAWSPSIILSTKPGLPLQSAPPAIAQGPQPCSLALNWMKPYGNGAPVDSYIVQMKKSSLISLLEDTKENDNGAVEGGDDAVTTKSSDGSSVQGHTTDNNNHSFITVYHSSESNCIVSNLEPNTEYLFRMRAFNSVGASQWSDLVSACTAPTAPSPPLSMHCTQATNKSLIFAWEQPEHDYGSPIVAYQLEYVHCGNRGHRAGGDKALGWKVAYKGSDAQYEITNLTPGTQYKARVRAQNGCGWGHWSEAVVAITEADVPGKLSAPTVTSRTGTRVRLTWSPPLETNGSPVSEYEVQMGEGSSAVTVYVGLDVTCKASDLAPGTAYLFRVRAGNAVGYGPWSDSTLVTTSCMPPLEPTEVVANVIDGNTVMIEWTAPQEDTVNRATCTSYEIECTSNLKHSSTQKTDKITQQKHVCSGRTSQFKICGLKCGAWVIKVRAIGADGAGHGEWSSPITVHIHDLNINNNKEISDAFNTTMNHDKGNGTAVPKLVGPHRRGQAIVAALPTASTDKDSVGSGEHFDESSNPKNYGKSSRASKVAVAKAKPRPKTLWTILAKAMGVNESTFKYSLVLATFFMFLLAMVSLALQKQ